MYFSPRQDRGHLGAEGIIGKYRDSFHELLNTLEKYQVEYDLGSERIIKDHGDVKNSDFIIGERSYNMVVFPPHFENLEPYVFDLIKTYLEQGGNVLSFAGIPQHIDGNKSSQVSEFIKNYPGQWIEKESLDPVVISQYLYNFNFRAIKPEKWDGKIFHQRRIFSDGQLLFIINFDIAKTANFHFEIKGKTAIRMDPFTGNHYTYPAQSNEDKLILSRQLPPAGSVLFFISNKNLKADELVEKDRSAT